jgi:DNA-binding response OmpR family regulator
MPARSKILIVDDEPFNVDYLEQELEELGYVTASAGNGQEALDQVHVESPDLVLLDIMMPILDGFAVLERLKADPATRDIPVIIISAMTDMASIVRGVKLGAEDYLPKPFDPTLLHARVSACLVKKRYRDQELEYLRQVEHLTAAAQAIEANTFDPNNLTAVTQRADALGNLARVFQRMAQEVYAREQRLRRQLEQLRLDVEEREKAASETVAVYIPMDRRQALAHGETLPDRTQGAALFADISGFTPLTEALARELGFQRGAEELTRQLNRVYTALIDEVHYYGGSVISFSGDAITCWLDGDDGLRGTACALAMQAAMRQFSTLTTPGGAAIPLAIKVAVATGLVRRFLVGDPALQYMDVLAGNLMNKLAAAEHHAERGEVLLTAAIVAQYEKRLTVTEWRDAGRVAVVSAFAGEVAPQPWPPLADDALTVAQTQPWVLPPIFEKVQSGKSDLLSELRPAAMLFLRFGGLDYDTDDEVGQKLDAFMHWLERVVDEYEGALLQLIVGDKGSYLYIAFGVPVAHTDDGVRAISAALAMQDLPAALNFITGLQIGITHGQVRAGAYGSPAQRAYGALGDKTNLAARLMMRAGVGEILCDEDIVQMAQSHFNFEPLPPITVKGKALPVTIYRPLGRRPVAEMSVGEVTGRTGERSLLIDRLSPADQQTLKVASVIGRAFGVNVLLAVYPEAGDRAALIEQLETLEMFDLIMPLTPEPNLVYSFKDPLTHEMAYNLMLFAQRRQLHRAVAEWHEQQYAADLSPYYSLLAHHWRQAEDTAKAIFYLERAGENARQTGDYQIATDYLNEALTLEAQGAVLSEAYRAASGA